MTLEVILCIIFVAIASIEAGTLACIFTSANGTLHIDETDPDDVKWKIELSDEVGFKQRIYILKIHRFRK